MAYDEVLAERIREILGDEPGLRERRMFGGLAFLLDGHLAAVASGRGGLMVRADPEARIVAEPGVEPVEMRGRVMTGWVRVDDSLLAGDDDLRRWVDMGVEYARSLPPR